MSEVRAIVDDPLSIRDWWSAVFMDVHELNEGNENRDGYTVKCFTKGFLPHSFQFVARIKALTPDEMTIETHGDFDGVGTIELSARDNATLVSVEWRVNVHQPYIRPLLRVFKPIFVWNHLWAMRQGRLGLGEYLQQRKLQHPTGPIQRPTFPHNLQIFQSPAKWRV